EEAFQRPDLEEEMQRVLKLISVINSARMKAKLKRRWPLRLALVVLEDADSLSRHIDLVKEQANVKDVRLTSELRGTPIGLKITPRYDLLGGKLKDKMPTVAKHLAQADSLRIYSELKEKGMIAVKLDGEEVQISREELSIDYVTTDEKYVVSEREGVVVALQVERDSDLISEGNVRDLARRLQALRKERGYNPTDILHAAYVAGLDSEWRESLSSRFEELTYLVRVKEIKIMDQPVEGVQWSDAEIDGKPIKISVE
ncbi:MAG: DUF5915 domain-containing protein, partial [Nitrososphaerales archaeon]